MPRIFSAMGVPPGSRVVVTDRPARRRRSASMESCVDFPQPSTPSKVTNGTGRRIARAGIFGSGKPLTW